MTPALPPKEKGVPQLLESAGGLERDRLFTSRDKGSIWKKYCGFLELSPDEFAVMQKLLLMEQIDLVHNSPLGRQIMGGRRPRNIYEFRKQVRLTRYADYFPYLEGRDDSSLAEKPATWVRETGKTSRATWSPYTRQSLGAVADDAIAALILSSASRSGEVLFGDGSRLLLNLPEAPAASGILALVAQQRLPYIAIPSQTDAGQSGFLDRIELGFREALRTGVDYSASTAVVLARFSSSFDAARRRSRPVHGWNPLAAYRFLFGRMKSKFLGRGLVPKDLWSVKGLVCGATDAAAFRAAIQREWGVQPLEIFATPQTGFIAMQGWNKKGMTFLPYRNFLEFIPVEDHFRSRLDTKFEPSAVLINEVKPGQVYELVATNFHAGPFLRYRTGHLIKIIALKDDEAKVNLPQMEYLERADDIIDLGGLARLDENDLEPAIRENLPGVNEWLASKESKENRPSVHIFLESDSSFKGEDEAADLICSSLSALNPDFAEYLTLAGANPIDVTFLGTGSIARSFSLPSPGKPPRINPPAAVLHDLISR